MKRNEKILVYAVTGFLAVVLGIAIVFGDEDVPKRVDTLDSKTMAELLGEGAGDTPNVGADKGDEGEGEEQKVEDENKPAKPIENVSLNMKANQPTPAEQVALLLGPSQRHGDYRHVQVASGDSLSQLTERWCGTTTQVTEVQLLNETVDTRRLQPGQKLVVPWVDDEELLAAHKERVAARLSGRGTIGAATTPNSGTPVPAAADGERKLYVVKTGDSAWRIAARFVANNEVPGFIVKMRKLNPQVANIDRLREGQEIYLPATAR